MTLKTLLSRLLLIVSVALVPAAGLHAATESQAGRMALRLVSFWQQRIVEAVEQALNTPGGPAAMPDNWPGIGQPHPVHLPA